MKFIRFSTYCRHLLRNLIRQPSRFSKRLSLRAFLFLISFSVFLVSAVLVVNRLYSLYKENRDFEKIRLTNLARETQQPDSAPADSSMQAGNTNDKRQPMAEQIPYSIVVEGSGRLNKDGILKIYEKNKAINADLAGWVYMPGYQKAIDYPVMQAEDNLFYLYKDFYKNKSFCGSIFMDAANNPGSVDRNIVLYGHAMLEMSMFGNLMDYPDKEEEYKNNTRIYLDLMNTQLEYEVFSTYYADASFNYRQITFADDEAFAGFLESIRAKSFYDYNIVPTVKDKILTLSTCNSYSGDDDRVVIHARLVRQTIFTGTDDSAPLYAADPPTGKEVISANMYLDKLELRYNTADREEGYEKAELNPVFLTDVRKYEVSLPIQAETCSLSLAAEDPKARIVVYLDDAEANPESIPVKKGIHHIYIVVTAQDGTYSRAYTITLKKEQPGG